MKILLFNLLNLYFALSIYCNAELSSDENKIAQFLLRKDATGTVDIGLVVRLLRHWETRAKQIPPERNAKLWMRDEMIKIIGLTKIDLKQCNAIHRLIDRNTIQLEFRKFTLLQDLNRHLNDIQFGLCIYFMDNNVNQFIDRMPVKIQNEFSHLFDYTAKYSPEFKSHRYQYSLRLLETDDLTSRENPTLNENFRNIIMNLAFLMKGAVEDFRFILRPEALKEHYKNRLIRTCLDLERASRLSPQAIDFLEGFRILYQFEENLRWKQLDNTCLLVRSRPDDIFDQAYKLYIRELASRKSSNGDYMNSFQSLVRFFNESPQNSQLSDSQILDSYNVRSHLETLDIISKLEESLPDSIHSNFIGDRLNKLVEISFVHGLKCTKKDLEYRFTTAGYFASRPNLSHYIGTYNEQQIDLCRRILVEGVNLALKQINLDYLIRLEQLSTLVRQSDPTRASTPLASWYGKWTREFLSGLTHWIHQNYYPVPNESIAKIRLELDLGEACNNLVTIAKNRDLNSRYQALVGSGGASVSSEPRLSNLVTDTIGYVQLCSKYHNLIRNFNKLYNRLERIEGSLSRNNQKTTFQKIVEGLW